MNISCVCLHNSLISPQCRSFLQIARIEMARYLSACYLLLHFLAVFFISWVIFIFVHFYCWITSRTNIKALSHYLQNYLFAFIFAWLFLKFMTFVLKWYLFFIWKSGNKTMQPKKSAQLIRHSARPPTDNASAKKRNYYNRNHFGKYEWHFFLRRCWHF